MSGIADMPVSTGELPKLFWYAGVFDRCNFRARTRGLGLPLSPPPGHFRHCQCADLLRQCQERERQEERNGMREEFIEKQRVRERGGGGRGGGEESEHWCR